MTDIEIINIFYTEKGKINPHKTSKSFFENNRIIKDYLNNRYSDSESIGETLYRIKNNIEVRPVCKVCGNPVKFVSPLIGFRNTCSISCAQKYINYANDIYDKNIILDDIIENGILNNNKLQNKYLKEHGYYNFINSIFQDAKSKSEKIYLLYNDMIAPPKCKICGKQLAYKNFLDGYDNCCIKEKEHNYIINDEQLLNLLCDKTGYIAPVKRSKEFLKEHDAYNYIMNRYSDSESIGETLYRIKNNIEVRPTCKICGNAVKFININKGFMKTCNKACTTQFKQDIDKTNSIVTDEYIKNNYYPTNNNHSDCCKLRKKELISKGVYTYLKNRYDDSSSIKETIYRICNNVVERPKCKICGKETKFRDLHAGYKYCCSGSCQLKLNNIQKYKTLGYDVSFDGPNIIIKNGCATHGDITMNAQTFWRRLNNNEEICTICNPHNTTYIEDKIIDLLNKHNIKYCIHDRQHIYPLELDLFLPEFNIGIECNGIYWHSDYNVEKDKQLNKLKVCNDKNIRLLTFWEDDINNHIGIIESILLSICNLNTKIYARKCIIKEIDSKTSKDFIDKNHLQGNINASIKLGLFYNDELVEVMTFGKTRKPLGGKQLEGEYELYRLCSKCGYTIVGGASKLLKYFKEHFNWTKLISYCQNDISNGNVYEKIGFTYNGDCGLSYCYYDKNGCKINRYSLRKNIVDDGSGRTADAIVKSLGYLKCWNSGNKKYVMINQVL